MSIPTRFGTLTASCLLVSVIVSSLDVSALGQSRAPARDRDRDEAAERRDHRDRDDEAERERDEREFNSRRPRISPERGRWSLGIAATDTETGVRVTRVVARSAADRAGLERGDVIVTVNGYQVGRVDGRLYDLPSELERRADRRGRVLLLVQNRRDGGLRNLDVRLDPRRESGESPDVFPESPDPPSRGETLTGRAYTRPPDVVLPFGARLTVQMFVLGGRGQPGQLIGQIVVPHSGTSPIPFTLRYDASRVAPGQDVGLVGEITAGGRVVFETRGVQRLGRPGTGPADLVLETVR